MSDFYYAQDIIARDMGLCPFTNDVKWIPDSITHPRCNEQILQSQLFRVNKNVNSLRVYQNHIFQTNGLCPSPSLHTWTMNGVFFPDCDEVIATRIENNKIISFDEYSKDYLRLQQSSVHSQPYGSDLCPHPSLTLVFPITQMYPKCQETMESICSLNNNMCLDNFSVRYVSQSKGYDLNRCPHPSQYTWSYSSPIAKNILLQKSASYSYQNQRASLFSVSDKTQASNNISKDIPTAESKDTLLVDNKISSPVNVPSTSRRRDPSTRTASLDKYILKDAYKPRST
jgi:hypothetical protein